MKYKNNKQKTNEKSKKIRSKSGFFCIMQEKDTIYKIQLKNYNKIEWQ